MASLNGECQWNNFVEHIISRWTKHFYHSHKFMWSMGLVPASSNYFIPIAATEKYDCVIPRM